MKQIYRLVAVSLIMLLGTIALVAQETEETVVDEVVAQVNDDVITLSQIRREKQMVVDQFKSQGKTPEEAQQEVAKAEGQLIANLITEEMIRQKGVELGMDKRVEAEVNQRLLKLVKDNKLKTIGELYQVMKQQGVDSEAIKESWRSEIMKQQVLFQMVDLVVYWKTSDQEVKDYYAANKEKFSQLEMAKLSEIFLTFAGKKEQDVAALAKSLVLRLKNGEDFIELAKQYSDRPDVTETNAEVGEFEVSKLNDDIRNAIKGLSTGDIAEPIRWDIGIEIIKVDNYTAASTEANFDENQVRRVIMQERAPAARVKFINELKKDSYIKIRENYRGIVSPFLSEPITEETKVAEATTK